MNIGLFNYRKKIRKSAGNGVTHTKEWAGAAKERIFNMELPQPMERALRNRLRFVSIITAIFALFTLFIMAQAPAYFATALIIGFIAMLLDFLVEYKGVSGNEWDYPVQHLSFRRIPIELPLLFFSCGVLITFVFCSFSTPIMDTFFTTSSGIAGLSVIQIILASTGAFFMLQYFRKKCKTLVFGALPISIALYLAFPEPWILVVSILPMYIDYYLEKRLVKSAHIQYNKYDEEVAINVAISYFPVALFILVLVALVHRLITISGV